MQPSDLTIVSTVAYGARTYEPGDEAALCDLLRPADVPGLVALGVLQVHAAPARDVDPTPSSDDTAAGPATL